MMLDQAKVIIVGAGPTEMTAAMELARQGIPVWLIEKSDLAKARTGLQNF